MTEYLGIPFAQPPVGDLRFAAPQPYISTPGATLAKDALPPNCPQLPVKPPSNVPRNEANILGDTILESANSAEDCLYLNVWTKASHGPLKPVLVYFYGGNWRSGGTNGSASTGEYFADEQDVVLVTFNYRLSIFGFSGAPGIPQNVGLLDQRMAVEWIRENIASFGGDPSRIVLFGQSAGSASVDFYNYAYTKDPIIAGSIMESGAASSFATGSIASVSQAFRNASMSLGCESNSTMASESSDATLACMRRQPQSALLSAVTASIVGLKSPFGPTVDNKTVFANYSALGKAGKFIRRPILQGSNDDEFCYFAARSPAFNNVIEQDNNVVFTCPTAATTRWHAQAGVPTWRYRYFATFPNVMFANCPGRAYHTAELGVLFGTSQDISGFPATPEEISMGKYLRAAWATFARAPAYGLAAGLPSSATPGSGPIKWPLYDPNGATLVQLGIRNNDTTPIFGSSVAYDGNCTA